MYNIIIIIAVLCGQKRQKKKMKQTDIHILRKTYILTRQRQKMEQTDIHILKQTYILTRQTSDASSALLVRSQQAEGKLSFMDKITRRYVYALTAGITIQE